LQREVDVQVNVFCIVSDYVFCQLTKPGSTLAIQGSAGPETPPIARLSSVVECVWGVVLSIHPCPYPIP
jgi:hypothetical protein